MYWQQAKLLPQFFTPEFELLGEKELLHNILPNFGACSLQLINLTFFNAFFIPSEVYVFQGLLALVLFGFKVEIKGKIFFFSRFFTFINLFWNTFKALFIPAFMILSELCSCSRKVSSLFHLVYFKDSFSVIIQILRTRGNGIFFQHCMK